MALAYATDCHGALARFCPATPGVRGHAPWPTRGASTRAARAVYHQALLSLTSGATARHASAGGSWGDEIALRRDLQRLDFGDKAEFAAVFVRAITRLFADASPAELAEAVERGPRSGRAGQRSHSLGHCEGCAEDRGAACLPDEIREGLGQIYERWDGRGLPRGLSGDAVKFPVRLVTLAQDAIALAEAHGLEITTAMIAKRAGGAYEAEVANLFLADPERLLAGLDGPVDREAILALEPTPHAMLDEQACEEAYLAIADFIDMRMPFTFGHSRAVAALASAAGKHLGLPASDIREVRWAAYAHDIGELTVPVSTWDEERPADRA